MTIRGSLDSNVLLRLLLHDVPEQHTAARALLETGDFVVHDAAIIEIIFVLGRHYRLTRVEQREAILGLLSQSMIVATEAQFVAAFDLYLERPKLSFEDCYLVTAAELEGNGPLFTFDARLASQTPASLVADLV